MSKFFEEENSIQYIREVLDETLREVVGCEPSDIDNNKNFVDNGLDSLDMISILMHFEVIFHRKVEYRDVQFPFNFEEFYTEDCIMQDYPQFLFDKLKEYNS